LDRRLGGALKPVWTHWRRDKIPNTDLDRDLVTTLTELPQYLATPEGDEL